MRPSLFERRKRVCKKVAWSSAWSSERLISVALTATDQRAKELVQLTTGLRLAFHPLRAIEAPSLSLHADRIYQELSHRVLNLN